MPIGGAANSWTPEDQEAEPRIFSPTVFSLVKIGSLHLFAIGSSVWIASNAPSSIWAPE